MPKIQVNGTELFYDISGVGQPLLLLSGFACDHSCWSLMMPLLAKTNLVIRVDNRGVGRSSLATHPYLMKDLAGDISALLEYLQIQKVSVIGHSMGAQIAQVLTSNYSEKVKNLILLSSWKEANSIFHNIIDTWGELPKILDYQQYQKVILPWLFTDKFLSSPQAFARIIKIAVSYSFRPNPQSLYYQSQAILNSSISGGMSTISCPTLVMVGRQDILTPVAFSQQLLQFIPQAELRIIDHCGHGLLIESPHTVASNILDFLARTSVTNI